MSTDRSQQTLRDLDTKLWAGADRLRANRDAAGRENPKLKNVLDKTYTSSIRLISAMPVEHANLGQFALPERKKASIARRKPSSDWSSKWSAYPAAYEGSDQSLRTLV